MATTLTTEALIEYKGKHYTGSDIEAMREWIADCEWSDLSPKEIKQLTPVQVLIGIKRNYGGGIPAFIGTIN